MDDFRSLLFGTAPWYNALNERNALAWPAWRICKSTEAAWWTPLLSAAASFAREHDLLEPFRARFSAIPPGKLQVRKALAEGRDSTFPIWEIANELIVARYLERVLGWRFSQFEPAGNASRKGDWQFTTPSDRDVFVEVKSLGERELLGSGNVFSRPRFGKRLQGVLKRAYKQLPKDDRATLVVLVGKWILRIPFGIMHGDLFEALYGRIEIRFSLDDPDRYQITPSFNETFANRTKNRHLSYVAALAVSGMDLPQLRFYAVHNAYADESVRLAESDFANSDRFIIDDQGNGRSIEGLQPSDVWKHMALEER